MSAMRPVLLTLGVTTLAAGVAAGAAALAGQAHHVDGHEGHALALVGMVLILAAVLIDAGRASGPPRPGRKDTHAHR